ncbi:DUF4349 domain-containing protein [Solicola gregarius]|uniref:DUF4349 domain-containing protein n=1 Tax=Solicola gregarius TaxID=2908642 RepID=A0AA46TEG5_9ACTN|nr:DUF4349 domain-containing protein [Solicola gregarius]UYM03841.1 DUF4349 domain-containing protein [Solicola gregarius]
MAGRVHRQVVVRAAALVCAALFGLAACSSSEDGDGGSSAAGDSALEGGAQQERGSDESAARDADAGADGASNDVSTIALEDRAIERRGSLDLTSKDVAAARDSVIDEIEGVGGYVADEQSTTGNDGDLARVHLQLVVPTDSFDEAMASSAGAGSVVSREQSAQDVTEKVVDVDSRVENAKSSLRRIRLLLGRAERLGDVIRLESVLGEREADLESLQAQQKSLEERTTTATVDVSIRPAASAPKPKPVDEDEAGFLAGLGAGWSGLQKAWTGLATVIGAVLPFALVLAIPVAAAVLLVRRAMRRRVATTSEAA